MNDTDTVLEKLKEWLDTSIQLIKMNPNWINDGEERGKVIAYEFIIGTFSKYT